MLRALTRRLLYTEDLLGIDLREESIKLFLRWDYFLKVRGRMALRFVFTLLADSVCEFLITASAYVLMVGSETFLSVVCPSGPFPTIFIKLSFPTVILPVGPLTSFQNDLLL
jgi:hypothetical protein